MRPNSPALRLIAWEISAMGLTVPISLLAYIMVTRVVLPVTALYTDSGCTIP